MSDKNFFFFLGGDTAPSETHRSDDGALTVGVARPLFEPEKGQSFSENPGDWRFGFVHSRVFTSANKLSCRQWSGEIYGLHERFGFEQILLDAGAGGAGMMVAREMLSPTQIVNNVEKRVSIIGDKVNAPTLIAHGEFILNMFKRGDPGCEMVWPAPDGTGKSLAGDDLLKSALYGEMKTAFDTRPMEMVPPAEEFFDKTGPHWPKIQTWPPEREWAIKNLDAAGVQLKGIIATQTPDGRDLFTSRGARIFRSLGKDDIAWSHMMCYGAFLIWLKSFNGREGLSDEDSVGFGG